MYFTRKLEFVSNIFGMIVCLNAIYEGFIYFILNILYLPYISAKFFISVVWKLSLDLRLQESESLKRVYGVKLFYLAKDERCSCLWTRKCFSLNFFDIEKNTVLEKKVLHPPKKNPEKLVFFVSCKYLKLFSTNLSFIVGRM